MNNIPTLYSGIRFRSRLEAKWAAFFDYLRWPWAYEPVDLNGWIPDFVLNFPYAPIAVEVKPVLVFEELKQYTSKLEASGWDKEMFVVGAKLFETDLGFGGVVLGISSDSRWGWPWGPVEFVFCPSCRQVALTAVQGRWECRLCGSYERYMGRGFISAEAITCLWNRATNKIQWKPPK